MRKHTAPREVLHCSAGRLVGIPFDQNAKRSEAIFVPFFTEMAATASGGRGWWRFPARRWCRCSSCATRQRIHRIESPGRECRCCVAAIAERDVAENTRRFVKAHRREVVRRYPEQFLWTHRRYRTRPRGTPPIYQKIDDRGLST